MAIVTEQNQNPSQRAAEMRQRALSALRQLPWLTEAQAALSWSILLILLAMLGAVYLSQASSIAIVGRRVQVLQGEFGDIKRVNAELEREIAEAQELEPIQQRAFALGFAPAPVTNVEYVIVPNYPVYIESEVLETYESISAPPETMLEVLWLMMRQRVSALAEGEAYEP
jgi:hypothetical protein